METIKIFTLLDTTKSKFKTSYYKRIGIGRPQIISKDKWFNLYDQSFIDNNITVLPPLTLE